MWCHRSVLQLNASGKRRATLKSQEVSVRYVDGLGFAQSEY